MQIAAPVNAFQNNSHHNQHLGESKMKIEMKEITKSFGANQVLKGVNFTIDSGEVHALMGENGAGKSTLMNILTGLYPANSGEILVDGQPTTYSGPMEAEQHGISFIHQEMNNFLEMSVVDNMFLNKELRNRFGLMDSKAMRDQADHYLSLLGAKLDVDQPIGSLSVGRQQMVEIAKSLMTDAKIIIMDEPTAALYFPPHGRNFRDCRQSDRDARWTLNHRIRHQRCHDETVGQGHGRAGDRRLLSGAHADFWPGCDGG